jgi:imidazolonepropionase-like amidohydrolase
VHDELALLVEAGLTPFEALQAATVNPARYLGLDHALGTVEPGKLADLVLLDGNPLEDIHNTNTIRYVMKNGRIYEGETLNEIWPRQRQLPKMWWWGTEPQSRSETQR